MDTRNRLENPAGEQSTLLVDSDGAGRYWVVRRFDNGDGDILEDGFSSFRAAFRALQQHTGGRIDMADDRPAIEILRERIAARETTHDMVATDFCDLLREHDKAVTALTLVVNRSGRTKTAAQALERANRKLFRAVFGRKPTKEELARCEEDWRIG